jgi:transposase
VYHGGLSVRALKELVHNYDALVSDTTRVMNRIKAIFRSRAIRCAGRDVYHQQHRGEWLQKLMEPMVRRRAEFLYEELESLKATGIAISAINSRSSSFLCRRSRESINTPCHPGWFRIAEDPSKPYAPSHDRK